ncbi:MAG: transporter, ATP-binding protein [Frankiales bacterium]|nr:transporter, ATP-binding protein [Frankiales bacterium]
MTIILVSHSLDLVADPCDQAAWLEGGTLKAVGSAREVVDANLAAVNQHEAEARLQREALSAVQGPATLVEPAVDATAEEPQGETPRRGSGEVRVTSVDYLDAEGAPLPFPHHGAPYTIKISYRNIQDLPSVTFGLEVTSQNGIQVAGPNSGHGDAAFAVKAGNGYVCFHIPSQTLQSGDFTVTTAAVDKEHTYDYLDRAFPLRVRADDATEPGLVKIVGSWSLTPAP